MKRKRTSDLLGNGAILGFIPLEGCGYYISRPCRLSHTAAVAGGMALWSGDKQYLRTDGTWKPTAEKNGFFPTKEEALAVYERVKDNRE